MKFLVIVKKVAQEIRAILDETPPDRDTRVNYRSHCGLMSDIAIFAYQQLGGQPNIDRRYRGPLRAPSLQARGLETTLQSSP
ncbi:MAG: hypothetical protein F4171_02930 [Gammaproteobacteria bacterium]|nr:hypothetical protein [Gammaproteobacteria bacterium]